MIVVQGPGLYEVLGELGVCQQAHGVRHNLNIGSGKLLQLQVHFADLMVKVGSEGGTTLHKLKI